MRARLSEGDESFLDECLQKALRALEEGRSVDVEELAGTRLDLAAEIESILDLVRQTAVTKPLDERVPTVPGYEILHELGRGGMGVVYYARQQKLGGRVVALKVLPLGQASPRARERFQSEANAIARLRHPNIVAVHDVVREEGLFAYAMEYVDGTSLQGVIEERRAGKADGRDARPTNSQSADARTSEPYWRHAARIGMQVARALAAVHQAGMLHRDVKPSNVLIARDGTALLSDFGLVRGSGAVTLTQGDRFVGTPAYASPEQLRGGSSSLDARSDVYSLGVTLYHALALERPFEGESSVGVLEAIRAGKVRGLRGGRFDGRAGQAGGERVPRDLETIVLKAMDAEPSRRYASAGELADDLDRLLHDEPVRARPATTMYLLGKFARRNRALVVGVALAFLAIFAGLVGTAIGLGRAEASRRLEAKARETSDASAKRARTSQYVASIQAAQAALRVDDVLAATRALEGAPVELRGWEWRYLDAQCDHALRHFERFDEIPGEQAGLRSLELDADGGRLLGVTFHRVVIWDAHTGRILRMAQIGDDSDAITSAAWAGDAIAIGRNFPARIEFLDPDCLGETREVRLPTPLAYEGNVLPGPTPDTLGYWHRMVRPRVTEHFVISIEDAGILEREVLGAMQELRSTPGSWRVVWTDQRRMAVLDWPTREWSDLGEISDGGGQGWHDATVSPDGSAVAVASLRGVQLVDARTGAIRMSMGGDSVYKWHRVRFADSGRVLWHANAHRLSAYDVATGKPLARLRSGSSIWSICVGRQSGRIFVGATDGSVREFSMDSRGDSHQFPAREGSSASAGAEVIATATAGWPKEEFPEEISFVNVASGEVEATMALGDPSWTGAGYQSFSPDGRWMARTQNRASRARLTLLDLKSGVSRTSDAEAWATGVAPGFDSKGGVVVPVRDGLVSLDAESLRERWRTKLEEPVDGEAGVVRWLDVRGGVVAASVRAKGAGRVVVCDAASGEIRCELRVEQGWAYAGVGVSPDGTRVACVVAPESSPAGAGEIVVWSVADGRVIGRRRVGDTAFPGLAWSPDGKRLALGMIDGTVRIVGLGEGESGEELIEMMALRSDYWMTRPQFSADGRVLTCVTVWPANRCVVWDARPESDRAAARARRHIGSWAPAK